MSRFIHPKWTFPRETKVHFTFGDVNTFGEVGPRSPELESFRVFLDGFLEKQGITDFGFEERMYHTGGHMDIDYHGLVVVDPAGAMECVVFLYYGGAYEAIVPYISLFGAWASWQDSLKTALVRWCEELQ